MLIESTRNVLTPIACKFYAPNFMTYIELDLVRHLSEVHHIGHGYLDTPPVPGLTSKSWSDDYRIVGAINEGKEIGARIEILRVHRKTRL